MSTNSSGNAHLWQLVGPAEHEPEFLLKQRSSPPLSRQLQVCPSSLTRTSERQAKPFWNCETNLSHRYAARLPCSVSYGLSVVDVVVSLELVGCAVVSLELVGCVLYWGGDHFTMIGHARAGMGYRN